MGTHLWNKSLAWASKEKFFCIDSVTIFNACCARAPLLSVIARRPPSWQTIAAALIQVLFMEKMKKHCSVLGLCVCNSSTELCIFHTEYEADWSALVTWLAACLRHSEKLRCFQLGASGIREHIAPHTSTGNYEFVSAKDVICEWPLIQLNGNLLLCQNWGAMALIDKLIDQ